MVSSVPSMYIRQTTKEVGKRHMQLFNRKYIILYMIVSTLVFLIGYIIGEKHSPIIVNNIYPKDIIYIYITNIIIIIGMLLLSITGISLFFIFFNIFKIGMACKESGINFALYFPISLLHGIFELLALYIIFSITLNYLYSYFQLLIKSNSRFFILNTKLLITKGIPFLIITILIGAIIEVLISNKILFNLLN